MKILITGACGWTAQAIIQTLYEAGHELIGFDLPSTRPEKTIENYLSDIRYGDIADYQQVVQAVSGIDAILHLAVAIGEGDYDSPLVPFDVNVRGTANLFEAARKAGVNHAVLMSSAAIHLEQEKMIDAVKDCPSSNGGDFLYDMSKCLQENIGKHYAQTFDMIVITLRAGHIVDGRKGVDPKGRSLSDLNYARGGWICRYDLAQAVVKAFEYQHSGYDAFHIIGAKQAQQYLDTSRTESVLDFKAEIVFEDYI